MNGSVIAAATSRKAYGDQIVLDGIGFRHTVRGPLARYDVMLGRLVAIGIIIGLVPAGKQGPGVRPSAPSSFTPLIETLRGLLTWPAVGGPGHHGHRRVRRALVARLPVGTRAVHEASMSLAGSRRSSCPSARVSTSAITG
ncbi:hypothetical protein [Nonomuraea sp. NPDC050202]|uniref:hypothetical protein n=1 Tax=Nonomuraea sp. NPDC050202 TaxID=3155035 RepID=UPI0033F18C64